MGSLLLRIGQVAQRAGVSTDTIRYYERIGVLPKQADRSSRWRILDYVDYAPAGVVTTSLFPLGTSAAAITGRLRPLDIDPRTGEKPAAHENGESGTT